MINMKNKYLTLHDYTIFMSTAAITRMYLIFDDFLHELWVWVLEGAPASAAVIFTVFKLSGYHL